MIYGYDFTRALSTPWHGRATIEICPCREFIGQVFRAHIRLCLAIGRQQMLVEAFGVILLRLQAQRRLNSSAQFYNAQWLVR